MTRAKLVARGGLRATMTRAGSGSGCCTQASYVAGLPDAATLPRFWARLCLTALASQIAAYASSALFDAVADDARHFVPDK